MSNVTIQSLKALAKSLRSSTTTHSQALELVAKQHGFKDWNAASASLPSIIENPYDLAVIRRKLEAFFNTQTSFASQGRDRPEDPDYSALNESINAYVTGLLGHLDDTETAIVIRFCLGYLSLRVPMSAEMRARLTRVVGESLENISKIDEMILARFKVRPDDYSVQHIFGYRTLLGLVMGYQTSYPLSTGHDLVRQITHDFPGRKFDAETVRMLGARTRSENQKEYAAPRDALPPEFTAALDDLAYLKDQVDIGMMAGWHESADRIIKGWSKMPQDMQLALLRHAIQVMRLPFHLGKMKSFKAVSEKLRNRLMDDTQDGAQEAYERYFPEAKIERLSNTTVTYAELVKCVAKGMQGDENISEGELLLFVRHTFPHQPFNEETVKGLRRRGAWQNRSEANFLSPRKISSN